jgi:predicted TIM-barrel fold metal-dependent hydrolase
LATERYVDLVAEKAHLPPYQRQMLLNGTAAKSLEDMDRNGVATSILSLTTPGVWFGDAAEARRLARELNEHFAKVAAEHKGRYGHFAVLPMPDIDGSLAEIEYALDHLKADGIAFYTSYGNKHLGDATFTPVLEELNRRKALAYTHPCRPDCCAGLLPEITDSAIEYGTDTTRTIASLVFSGAATRFPDIRWIFSHAGGTMPFLIGRFVGLAQSPQFARHLPDGVLPVLRRFYYDTAQVAHQGAMSSLMTLVAISQVVFGTDFPFRNAADHVKGLGDCGFTADELTAIEHVNAGRLIPRLAR